MQGPELAQDARRLWMVGRSRPQNAVQKRATVGEPTAQRWALSRGAVGVVSVLGSGIRGRFWPNPEQPLDDAAGDTEILDDGPDRLPGLVADGSMLAVKNPMWAV